MCETTEWDSTCSMRTNSLEFSSACIRLLNLKAPASGWPMPGGLFNGTVAGSGPKQRPKRAPRFSSHCRARALEGPGSQGEFSPPFRVKPYWFNVALGQMVDQQRDFAAEERYGRSNMDP